MTTPFDVDANVLVGKIAEKLKTEYDIKAPEWALYAKTGVHKERLPVQKDWWHLRASAVLRKLYIKGPIGVERLRAEYGGAKRGGSRTPRAEKGSGSVIRKILQQLEVLGLVSKIEGEGRVISPQGRSLLDLASYEITEMKKNE